MTIERAIRVVEQFSLGSHVALNDEELKEYNDICYRAILMMKNSIVALPNSSKQYLIKRRDGHYYCRNCGKFFEPRHAERKPQYCERCGAELKWE